MGSRIPNAAAYDLQANINPLLRSIDPGSGEETEFTIAKAVETCILADLYNFRNILVSCARVHLVASARRAMRTAIM